MKLSLAVVQMAGLAPDQAALSDLGKAAAQTGSWGQVVRAAAGDPGKAAAQAVAL